MNEPTNQATVCVSSKRETRRKSLNIWWHSFVVIFRLFLYYTTQHIYTHNLYQAIRILFIYAHRIHVCTGEFSKNEMENESDEVRDRNTEETKTKCTRTTEWVSNIISRQFINKKLLTEKFITMKSRKMKIKGEPNGLVQKTDFIFLLLYFSFLPARSVAVCLSVATNCLHFEVENTFHNEYRVMHVMWHTE